MSVFGFRKKFRAWDAEAGEMVLPVAIDCDGQAQWMRGGTQYISKPDEVMQFIGMWDVGGKEVFEEDVLQCTDGYVYKVHAVKGGWVAWQGGKIRALHMLYRPRLVGNTYQNPNILALKKPQPQF